MKQWDINTIINRGEEERGRGLVDLELKINSFHKSWLYKSSKEGDNQRNSAGHFLQTYDRLNTFSLPQPKDSLSLTKTLTHLMTLTHVRLHSKWFSSYSPNLLSSIVCHIYFLHVIIHGKSLWKPSLLCLILICGTDSVCLLASLLYFSYILLFWQALVKAKLVWLVFDPRYWPCQSTMTILYVYCDLALSKCKVYGD